MNLTFSLHDRPRKVWLAAAAGALAVIGLLAWLALTLPTGPRAPKVVANNISRNFRTCLINSQRDASVAQTVWSALQKGADSAAINAQHITIPRSSTTARALPYVNSLVQHHCGLVVSVGPSLHDAVTTAARNNPHQKFIAIGASIELPNVQTFSPADQSAAVSAVQKAARPRLSPRT
ncbi:BMP family ABC transporter substrate-binding protein [Streptomyces murinus]|uniref:BMP family ABC transporter substrate-binding protein n=1 Tax=Streptomyces murinus TaxID=33900 RepID=UPI0013021C04|nr:BMP family ABC transporter substrate-binding protein [Streptomyces murinus]